MFETGMKRLDGRLQLLLAEELNVGDYSRKPLVLTIKRVKNGIHKS
jgi:hypothetical protein